MEFLDDKDMVILAGLGAVAITAAVTPSAVPEVVKMYLSGILGMAVGRHMVTRGGSSETKNEQSKNVQENGE